MNEAEIKQSIAWHHRTNIELVKRIESHGANLDETRTVDLHFLSADEQDAHALMARLKDIGMVNLRATRQKSPLAEFANKISRLVLPKFELFYAWMVEGQLETTVNRVSDRHFTEQLIRMAAKCNSTFGGWGTAV